MNSEDEAITTIKQMNSMFNQMENEDREVAVVPSLSVLQSKKNR